MEKLDQLAPQSRGQANNLIKFTLALAIVDLILLAFVFSGVLGLQKDIAEIKTEQSPIAVKKKVREEKTKIVKERIPEKYVEVNLDISKWITFKDSEGRFEFKYPEDYHYRSSFEGTMNLNENQVAIFGFNSKEYSLWGNESISMFIDINNKNFDVEKSIKQLQQSSDFLDNSLLILNDKYKGVELLWGSKLTDLNNRIVILPHKNYSASFSLVFAGIISPEIFYQILDSFKFLK